MSLPYKIRWQAVFNATLIIALIVGWWWYGQSVRQPNNTPVRQTPDIRPSDSPDQQTTQDAINALGSSSAN